MGETWNKKKSVEDNKTQWSVIIALLTLLCLPIIGVTAIFFLIINDAPLLTLLVIGGLCLFSLALPLMALFYLRRAANRDDERRDGQVS